MGKYKKLSKIYYNQIKKKAFATCKNCGEKFIDDVDAELNLTCPYCPGVALSRKINKKFPRPWPKYHIEYQPIVTNNKKKD